MSRDTAGRSGDALPDEGELMEILDELEDAEETVGSASDRRTIRRTRQLLSRLPSVPRFGWDDIAQQVVGAVLLSAPFVVTEEVWSLAASMNPLQTGITVFMVFAVGYVTLYQAEDHEAGAEPAVLGVPLRFVTLIVVSYSSVAVVAFVFDAPEAFEATLPTTVKAVCIGAVFSVIGAASADGLF